MDETGRHSDRSRTYAQGKDDVEREGGQLSFDPKYALVSVTSSPKAYYSGAQRGGSFAAILPQLQRAADGHLCSAMESIQRAETGCC